MSLDPERRHLRNSLAWGCVAALCLAHGWAIWIGLGGRAGLESGWPIWRDDHPLYYHSALVTRQFLKSSGTTAGYDPSFMAGYAKSVVFPASSTLPELVVAAFGGRKPELAYKLYVLIGAGAIPWLVAIACALWRFRPEATTVAVLAFLVYVWTDFPIYYAGFGMVPYLLVVPLGLVATAVFSRYLEHGGFGLWLLSSLLMVFTVLVHLTGAMLVAPAAALAYGVAWRRPDPQGGRLPRMRHVGVWLIPILVLAGNAFWWLPGIALASTKGRSDFAFVHRGDVLLRLWHILEREEPIEAVLFGLGLPGLWALYQRARTDTVALVGFSGAGFFWGYLAGNLRALDFLQPGRHTFACYTGLAVAAGYGLIEVLAVLGTSGGVRIRRWVVLGLVLVGVRFFGPPVSDTLRRFLGLRDGRPFLASRPPARLLWVVDRIKSHMQPGERLLYEEGGFELKGAPDPFQGGRFSGLLPERTGVEVLGGPYLHAALTTNFTQFGEGKLFGTMLWDRHFFEEYARVYRPSGIVCWTPYARLFCRANPDMIKVLDDDGVMLFGRIVGFEGATIQGSAQVEAERDGLRIRDARPGPDGLVVLRYHYVPRLRTDPPVPLIPVREADDPVPFIGFRPPAGGASLFIRMVP